jgi:urease accessory protein
MGWHAQLAIGYQREAERTVARHTHVGPLRILQSLYPEGDAVCHNVLVHPPGGLVGGDTLEITVNVASEAHGLITTPGATRFYRSDGETALQKTRICVESGGRMEWLPLEALCYSACVAENHTTFDLQPEAELLGWDITALGLPRAEQPFVQGRFLQHMEVPGVWLERGLLDARDARFLDGPVGLAGHRCIASLFFMTGSAMSRSKRNAALDCARELIAAHALASTAGATNPNPQVVMVRVLAPVVEPAMQLLRQVRQAWRSELWALQTAAPRIWAM